MSRIGKMPITIPDGVKVAIDNSLVKVDGPKGHLAQRVPPGIGVSVEKGVVAISNKSSQKKSSALHGLTRSLIFNMVTGVSKGFEKSLELVGIGYRAELKGTALHLSLGYSHPVRFELPKGITAKLEKQTKITIEGIDKQLVGETAAIIRSFKKPEPYKGKGIKYVDERIMRKAGKTGAK
ncbi:MAG: 50S ribosomal protein L6 [Deltaproteobacteria bacterium]|nr:50S ribosomal protein L6 [Deltaproteobacteria bacterium]